MTPATDIWERPTKFACQDMQKGVRILLGAATKKPRRNPAADRSYGELAIVE
jgi:hypothetical protein